MPWTVAGEAELVLAVWTACLVDVVLLRFRLVLGSMLTTAVLSRKVDAALRVETGDIGWISSEQVLGNRCVPTIGG